MSLNNSIADGFHISQTFTPGVSGASGVGSWGIVPSSQDIQNMDHVTKGSENDIPHIIIPKEDTTNLVVGATTTTGSNSWGESINWKTGEKIEVVIRSTGNQGFRNFLIGGQDESGTGYAIGVSARSSAQTPQIETSSTTSYISLIKTNGWYTITLELKNAGEKQWEITVTNTDSSIEGYTQTFTNNLIKVQYINFMNNINSESYYVREVIVNGGGRNYTLAGSGSSSNIKCKRFGPRFRNLLF